MVYLSCPHQRHQSARKLWSILHGMPSFVAKTPKILRYQRPWVLCGLLALRFPIKMDGHMFFNH